MIEKENFIIEKPPSAKQKNFLRIALLCNIRHIEHSRCDLEAEFDAPETIYAIKKALQSRGHTVFIIEADETAPEKLRKFKNKIDLVFNIAEGLRGESRESYIPSILEMYSIPYTGSGPLALATTLNKTRTLEILDYYGIPAPRFQLFQGVNEKLKSGLKFPLIVKPNWEGSSKGIYQRSVIGNEKELKKILQEMFPIYDQPMVVSEFLPGREFTLALLGNGKETRVLPIVEVNFKVFPRGSYKIDSYEAKWLWDNPEKPIPNAIFCPAKISKKLQRKMEIIALRAFEVLECRDWARLDLRLDAKGEPRVIEVNALPGIIPDPQAHSRFPRAAREAGISYDDMINAVLESALGRYPHLCESQAVLEIPPEIVPVDIARPPLFCHSE